MAADQKRPAEPASEASLAFEKLPRTDAELVRMVEIIQLAERLLARDLMSYGEAAQGRPGLVGRYEATLSGLLGSGSRRPFTNIFGSSGPAGENAAAASWLNSLSAIGGDVTAGLRSNEGDLEIHATVEPLADQAKSERVGLFGRENIAACVVAAMALMAGVVTHFTQASHLSLAAFTLSLAIGLAVLGWLRSRWRYQTHLEARSRRSASLA